MLHSLRLEGIWSDEICLSHVQQFPNHANIENKDIICTMETANEGVCHVKILFYTNEIHNFL